MTFTHQKQLYYLNQWNRPDGLKQSDWLRSTLSEVDSQMKEMLKIIGEDGDSFAQRAEMYFEKRPQRIEMSANFHHDQMLKNSIKIDDSGLNTAKSMKNTAKSTKTSNESRLDLESMVEDPEIKENELSVRCMKVERNFNGNDISHVHSSKNENGEYLYDSKKEVEDLVLEEINLCTQFPKAYDPKKERTHSTYGLNGENGDSDNDPKRGAGDSACDVKRDTVKLTNNLEYWKEERESDHDALSLNECDVKRNNNIFEYGSKRYNGDYACLKERESCTKLKVRCS
ncbi:hypothetical protein AMTRI_Chr02g215840 [Amborella trichopoda]